MFRTWMMVVAMLFCFSAFADGYGIETVVKNQRFIYSAEKQDIWLVSRVPQGVIMIQPAFRIDMRSLSDGQVDVIYRYAKGQFCVDAVISKAGESEYFQLLSFYPCQDQVYGPVIW